MESLDERDADESNEELGPYTFQLSGSGTAKTPIEWTAYCAIHRPDRENAPQRVILELERVEDARQSTCATPEPPRTAEEKGGMESCGIVEPSAEDLLLSTVSLVKPLRELSRSRGSRVGSKQKELNVVQLLSQVNEQFSRTENLEEFYRVRSNEFLLFRKKADVDLVDCRWSVQGAHRLRPYDDLPVRRVVEWTSRCGTGSHKFSQVCPHSDPRPAGRLEQDEGSLSRSQFPRYRHSGASSGAVSNQQSTMLV